MRALSSRWPALLCMVTLFLGWLAPVTLAKGIKTSEVFKVLTDADGIGGSCDKRMSQVEALIPEVQELIDAATDALEKLLSDPLTLPVWTKSKKLNRMRLLLLARQFLGTEWDEKSLKVKDKDMETGTDFKKTLTDFRDEFNNLRNEIEKKNKNYRFACDDSWIEKVTELKTDIGKTKKGTPISDVEGLKGASSDEYAWFDRGGPKVRPAKSAEDTSTQRSWYFSAAKGWPAEGPCAPIVVDGKPSAPYAETIYSPQKIIFFCKRIWDSVDGQLKKDLRDLKKAKIATDGSEYIDSYMSPGAILLHEMTHQVFQSEDHAPNALGYDFVNVIKGRKYPDRAVANADSYPYFALAVYLSQVEWHSGKAREIGKHEEDTHATPGR